MRYRRAWIAGGTYFFTLTLADRDQRLLVDRVDTLREAVRAVRERHPFHIDAMVVLPEHLHAIWTLPPGDHDFANRWRQIKAAFSRRLPEWESRSAAARDRGERGIWQRRYWEHAIRDHGDFDRHVDYVHFNPVKHGLVVRPVDWPYSSVHRFVRLGVLSPDWAAGPADDWGTGE